MSADYTASCMFGHLRLFSIISLLAVVIVAVAAGMSFRSLETRELTQILEQNEVSLARGYIDNVWKKYSDTVISLSLTDTSRLKDNPAIAQFAQETVQYFQRMPLLRVNIYNSAGLLLMTVNASGANKTNSLSANASLDPGFILRQLGHPDVSSMVRDGVKTQSGTELTVLQTAVPIRSTTGHSNEGVLELLYDVSEPIDRIIDIQFYGTFGFIVLFLVFLVVLFVTSKRAENIIAKQHESNLELVTAAAAAQAESRDKSQFLANVSHELRTPLNAIIGFSDIIKNEVMPQVADRKYHDYIGDINSSGVHLLSLINDILDYSKAEAGKLELEVAEVNVSKLIQTSMRLVGTRADAAQVKLVETLPKEPVVMVIDSKKFRQILLNLLSNAVKFTPPGGEVRINAWRNISDDTYSFEVKDTGIGIAPKDISRAMAPFGQVDSALSRKYEGTGLGLPLTKKFVELMGGKFAITSELNVGTTITFTLPREAKPPEGVVVKKQEI